MASRTAIVPIIPCSDLQAATRFFVRLGFTEPTDEEAKRWDGYLGLLHHAGTEVHLRLIDEIEKNWLKPESNPFGVYLKSKDVEALAAEFKDEIIERGKKAELKEWGMLEFSINGPDGCLVRVGWPADELGSTQT